MPRIPSLDILRGIAILGIFAMNIRNFALPIAQFDNPAFPTPPATAADLWTWAATNILFEDKMIALLSILFGAGIVLAAANAARPALTHYRRMAALLVIGLAHAYGLWYGDILNTYAICGLLLYPVHGFRPATLISLGVVVLCIAIVFRLGPAIEDTLIPTTTPAPPSAGELIFKRALNNEAAAYHGSWLDLARWRADLNTFWHFHGCIAFNFYRCGGFMLIGMGLVKLGILSAEYPRSVYWSLALAAYTIGLCLFAAGFVPQLNRALGQSLGLSPTASRLAGPTFWTLRYCGSAFLAIGHLCLIMLLCRTGSPLLAPLAAAGRLALSNYLLQTLIAITIFDGWAFAQWGTWRMHELYLLVAAVWVLQLILSPLYLRSIRIGPAEWVWRSVSHWRLEPLRPYSRTVSAV